MYHFDGAVLPDLPDLVNQIDGAEVWATSAGYALHEIAVDVSDRGSFEASEIFSGRRHRSSLATQRRCASRPVYGVPGQSWKGGDDSFLTSVSGRVKRQCKNERSHFSITLATVRCVFATT